MVTTYLIPKLGLKHHVLDQGGIPIQIHVPTDYRAGCYHFSDQPIWLVRDLVKLSTENIMEWFDLGIKPAGQLLDSLFAEDERLCGSCVNDAFMPLPFDLLSLALISY